MTSSRYDASPAPERSALATEESDSANAQIVADREGPGVSIRADVSWVGGSRMLRGHFNLDDDAYVVVGQIDPDGVVRVLFPTDPQDQGLVRGNRSYQTNESFAGFEDQFNYRASQARFTSSGYTPLSYDRGVGYMFVIASWRPMQLSQMASTNDGWDSYEIADDSYLRDPRPAIYELASLLAGTNREAYTVKFATYFSTTTDGFGQFGFGNSAFSSAYCPGAGVFGFASSPFSNSSFSSFYNWGESFAYRGEYYGYNAALNCYSPAGAFYNPFGARGSGFGYLAQLPLFPRTPGQFIQAGNHRSPLDPHSPLPPVLLHPRLGTPLAGQASDRHLVSADQRHYDPEYRSRGLKTDDTPLSEPSGHDRRLPHIDGNAFDMHSRPSIQQMVSRRATSENEGRDGSRNSRISTDASTGTMRQAWAQQRVQNEGRSSNSDAQTRMRTDNSSRSYTPSHSTSGSQDHRSDYGRSSGADRSSGSARSAGSPSSGSYGGTRSGSAGRASSPAPTPARVSPPSTPPAPSSSSGPSKP
jgi:hypothetical protein